MTFATTHLPTNSYPILFPTYQRLTRSATIFHQINKLCSTFRYSCLYCRAALVEPFYRSSPIFTSFVVVALYAITAIVSYISRKRSRKFLFLPSFPLFLCDTRSWEPWPSNAGLLNVFYWLWICGRREEHTVISVSKNRCQLKTGGWGAACPGHGPGSLRWCCYYYQ